MSQLHTLRVRRNDLRWRAFQSTSARFKFSTAEYLADAFSLPCACIRPNPFMEAISSSTNKENSPSTTPPSTPCVVQPQKSSSRLLFAIMCGPLHIDLAGGGSRVSRPYSGERNPLAFNSRSLFSLSRKLLFDAVEKPHRQVHISTNLLIIVFTLRGDRSGHGLCNRATSPRWGSRSWL